MSTSTKKPEDTKPENNETNHDNSTVTVSEVKLLKEQADVLGLQYPRNATAEKMKAIIAEHEAKMKAEAEGEGNDGEVKNITNYDKNKIQEVKDQALRRVRVQIICNDPTKQNWTGIAVTAGNDVIGHIQRVVPLNNKPWHVEAILLEVMRGMHYQHFPQIKSKQGLMYDNHAEGKLMPTFTIQELPPLTKAELEALAERQAKENTGRTENS